MNSFEFIPRYGESPLVVYGKIKGINTSANSEDFNHLVTELGFIRIYNELTGEFRRLELRNRGGLKIILVEPRYSLGNTADIYMGVRSEQEFAEVLRVIVELSKVYSISVEMPAK